ncbi:MAG: metallophosphoesterase [Clostridiaceae bacterium]|jgi:predicted MPP superfamily phosphohydrolase|nr:metallophosphoesterase [Clostridiaceae bacterium]
MKKFLSIIFFTIISIFYLSGSASANEIKFAQVTDTHYSLNNTFKTKVLTDTVDSLNKRNDIAFVIFTGDNIDTAHVDNLEGFMGVIKKLNKPYYIVIGNHDVFKSNGLSKEKYMEIVNEYNIFSRNKKPNYIFKKNGFVFMVVDGAKEVIPGANGYYRKDTLDWLDKQLTKYKKYPVVICQHFPVVPPRDVKSHTTYQAEKYIEIINKHNNVIAVIAGHYHMNGEKMLNGVYHISSPSLLVEPNNYKIITVVTTQGFSPMIYTELVPVENVTK